MSRVFTNFAVAKNGIVMAIDIILAIVIASALVSGAIVGLVRQLGTLVGFVIAVLACRFFGGDVADMFVSADSAHAVVLRGCCYAAVFVLAFLSVSLLARLLHATVNAMKLGAVNRVLGALFRAVLWMVVASVCLNIYFAFAPGDKDGFRNPSRPWRAWVTDAAPALVGFIGNPHAG